jgi:hypothetical protein
MTLEHIRQALAAGAAPEVLSPALRSMWEDARGNWNEAHSIAQAIDDPTGSWIHAYLHRKEGDLGNASYWYRRAGRRVPHDALEAEWERIVSALLGAGPAVLDDE